MIKALEKIVTGMLEKTNLSAKFVDIFAEIIYILFIFIFCGLVYILANTIIIALLRRVSRRTENTWDDMIIESKCVQRALYVLPAAIFYSLTPILPTLQGIVQLLLTIYIVVMIIYAMNSFLNALGKIYDKNYVLSKKRPIKSFLTVLKILIVIIGAVIIISKLLNQSPLYILSGLGALSAISLLIFKDAILGMVAGFQIASNDLVRIGDWIEMPKYGADGDVIDISLTIVKVQNWDKTITTIPAYALVSDSFKNWRGMQSSGGRRIKRSINIDLTTIGFCSDELLGKLSQIEYLKDYIKARQEEINNYNEKRKIDTSILVNGRRMTNIGIFRQYIVEYLKSNPKVHKNMISMVRQLPPNKEGVPLEIYCFTNDIAWINYENIMSDIFDHLFAVVTYFELKMFQEPSGGDIRALNGNVKKEK